MGNRASEETRAAGTSPISVRNRTNQKRTRANIPSEQAPPLPEDPTSYSDSCNSKLDLHVSAAEVHNSEREACK